MSQAITPFEQIRRTPPVSQYHLKGSLGSRHVAPPTLECLIYGFDAS